MNTLDSKGILLDAMLRLEAQFPTLLRTYHQVEYMELEFFQEEVAMDCAEQLQAAGISTLYSLQKPKTLAFLITPNREAETMAQIVPALERYFQALNFRWRQSLAGNDSQNP